jgi:hypothetical protein
MTAYELVLCVTVAQLAHRGLGLEPRLPHYRLVNIMLTMERE